MGRGHCAAPLYGFQASGTQLILGEGKRKIRWWGYIRACEWGEGGRAAHQVQDGDKGGKAKLAVLGVEGNRK